MGHVVRILAFLAILLTSALPLAAFDGPTQGAAGPAKSTAKDAAKDGAAKDGAKGAEQKPDPSAQEADEEKTKAAATAQRMLDAGVKAYADGNAKQAVRALDSVLRGGGLGSQQIAKALYYRGLAYRKQGKPGLAISDLTNAAWLKDGLSQPEQQDALKNRAAAYQDAGISNVASLNEPAPVAAAAPTGPAPAGPAPAGAPAPNGGGAWQTATTGWGTVPQTAYAGPSPSPPAPQPAANSSSSSGGISGFFSNIFGGGSSSSPAPSAASAPSANDGAVTTASIANANANAQPAPQSSVSSWSDTTQVSPATAPQSPAQAPAQSPAAVAAPPPTPTRVAVAPPPSQNLQPPTSGKFSMQIGAVRSRPEADMLVARLLTQHGGDLGARDPEVGEAVIGSMGTFYHVKVGPYAEPSEPKRLCTTLQADGFDCLVVIK